MRWLPAIILLLLPQESPSPIDAFFESAWKEAGKTPAGPAEDAIFLRRVTLDLTGRLPTADEIRAFEKSKDRGRAIDALLAGDDAAVYYADLWMQWLIDYDFEPRDLYTVGFSALHDWIQKNFKDDLPYNDFVRALLADRGDRAEKPAVNYSIKHLRGGEPPVKLAVMSARLFLGRDIRCAQCHDHPFDKMTQEEFWGYVGFYRPLANAAYGLEDRPGQMFKGAIADHLGEVRAEVAFLDGRKPAKDEKLGDALARLTLSADGHAVSRALVDRFWRVLFGQKPPPKLLDALAAEFEQGGWRVKSLFRRILTSRAYQMSSSGSEDDRKAYLAGPFKSMNLVQFMNAFSDAFDLKKWHEEMYQRGLKDPKTMDIFKDREVMRLFFHKWAKDMVLPKGSDPELTEATGTVRLSLKLMNNAKIQSLVSTVWGKLKDVLSKKSKPADRVDLLFLTLLGRHPTAGESKKFAAYIESKNGDNKAYEDVFWVLVNSAEFLFVH